MFDPNLSPQAQRQTLQRRSGLLDNQWIVLKWIGQALAQGELCVKKMGQSHVPEHV
jgi:hypothetical protein